jgi:anti-anti-sigma factor
MNDASQAQKRLNSSRSDLGGVDFIDSTGLHVLLSAAKRSREDGNRLSIWLGPGTAVRRLVELCGVEEQLPLTERSRGLQPRWLHREPTSNLFAAKESTA